MQKIIRIPRTNPVKYTQQGYSQSALYNSKHIDDHPFIDTIYDWEQQVSFKQCWQKNDTIHQQIRSEIGPLTLKVYDEDGTLQATTPFTQMLENANNPGEFIYEASQALSGFTPGCFTLKIEIGSPLLITLVSETIIISEIIENSLLLRCKHSSSFWEDVFYSTGFNSTVRIPAVLKPKTPASKDTLYNDQTESQKMLYSVPYRVWLLSIGLGVGVPFWFIDKISRVLGCDELLIEGKGFTKEDGAKLSEETVDNYPMAGWAIEMREKDNSASTLFGTEYTPEDAQIIIITTDDTGFMTSGSGYQVEVIE